MAKSVPPVNNLNAPPCSAATSEDQGLAQVLEQAETEVGGGAVAGRPEVERRWMAAADRAPAGEL